MKVEIIYRKEIRECYKRVHTSEIFSDHCAVAALNESSKIKEARGGFK